MSEANKNTIPLIQRPAARNFGIALLCAAVVLFTLYKVGYLENFADILRVVGGVVYNPLAIVLLVLLALQYIVLKSSDRSRLLQVELDKLRGKRREEITTLRKTRKGLEDLKARIDSGEASNEGISKDEVERLIDNLRPAETRLLSGEKAESE